MFVFGKTATASTPPFVPDEKFAGFDEGMTQLADRLVAILGTVPQTIFSDFENLTNGVDDMFGSLLGGLKETASSLLKDLGSSLLSEIIGGGPDGGGGLLGQLFGGGSGGGGGFLGQLFGGGSGGPLGGLLGGGGLFGFAGGGRVQPNKPVLVGERGPELLVPGGVSTVVNNSDTRTSIRQMLGASREVPVMMGGGFASAPAPARPTQVVVHNHSGGETQTRRRNGPGGEELIEVIIGRVADDMARGGRVADAASGRFGLNARGT